MSILKRPLSICTIAIIGSFVLIALFQDLEKIILSTWLILLSWFIAVTMHELGHVLFGVLNGLTFQFVAVGPFTISKEKNKLRFTENKQWMYAGGVTLFTPPSLHTPNLAQKWGILILGGPLISFISFLLSFGVYQFVDIAFLQFLAVFHLLIFIMTSIPLKMGTMNTDGLTMLTLWKNDEKARTLLHNIFVNRELFSEERPKNWSTELTDISKSNISKARNNASFDTMFLFYAESDKYGRKHAAKYLEPMLKVVPKKEEKYMIGAFHSLYLLHQFLDNEENNKERLTYHLPYITRLDLFSYYRSVAIVKYLEGQEIESQKYLGKAEKEIKNPNQSLGFLQLEREWFEELKARMISA
jgi:hypothetical protein